MNSKVFVNRVRNAVIENNSVADKELLESTSVESAQDPYWKRLLGLYDSMNAEQRAVLLEAMRQIRVDTVSEIFGILDGSAALEAPREDLALTTIQGGQKLNGDLQDLFLELEERDRQ
jgi:hypothetical protein